MFVLPAPRLSLLFFFVCLLPLPSAPVQLRIRRAGAAVRARMGLQTEANAFIAAASSHTAFPMDHPANGGVSFKGNTKTYPLPGGSSVTLYSSDIVDDERMRTIKDKLVKTLEDVEGKSDCFCQVMPLEGRIAIEAPAQSDCICVESKKAVEKFDALSPVAKDPYGESRWLVEDWGWKKSGKR